MIKENSSLPNVLLIAMGGTISMKTSASGGVVPTLTVDDFIAENPQLSRHANLKGIQYKQTASSGITLSDLLHLAATINHCAADGIVVVQGTDTMEESAFVLQCLCADAGKSVVLTGAMRNPSQVSSDSLLNLQNAVRVAADERSKTLGVLLSTGYAVYSATQVTKWNTVNVQAFGSDKGMAGWIAEDRFHLANIPVIHHFLEGFPTGPLTDKYLLNDEAFKRQLDVYHVSHLNVPIYKMALDDNGSMLKALLEHEPDALIIEGMGGGHVPAPLVEVLQKAAGKIPVLLCSRSAFGEVLTNTYGYKGSEIELIDAGLIPAAWLPSLKVRLLVMLILMLDENAFSNGKLKAAFEKLYQA